LLVVLLVVGLAVVVLAVIAQGLAYQSRQETLIRLP